MILFIREAKDSKTIVVGLRDPGALPQMQPKDRTGY